MFNLFKYGFLTLIFLSNAFADDVTSALQQVQNCLTQQNCESLKTEAGQNANQKALDAVGGNQEKLQQIYNVSAEIMNVLFQQIAVIQKKFKKRYKMHKVIQKHFLILCRQKSKIKLKILQINL